MIRPEAPRTSLLESSRMITWFVIVACGIIMLATVREVPTLGAGGAMVDFDAFYIVGQLAWNGTLTQAYDADVMREMQHQISGRDIFMPWTYPPHFDLVTALFPLGSRGLSYALFITSTFIAYVLVLRTLAGHYLSAVLMAVLPALVMTVRIGQNGLLTGALVGVFCLASLRGRAAAGVPLGLMVIKPHLALGLGVMLVMTRRWQVLAIALGVVAVFSGLATLAFGTAIWPAFLGSVPEAAENLKRGLYPMFRMTSAYAALRSLGAGPDVAMMAQAGVAAAACAAIIIVARERAEPRRLLGLTCIATLAFSPYSYDYDMPILGVGLALLAKDLMERARPKEKLALLALTWLTCGWGVFILSLRSQQDAPGPLNDHLSLAALGHLLLFGLVCHVLRRATAPSRLTSRAAV